MFNLYLLDIVIPIVNTIPIVFTHTREPRIPHFKKHIYSKSGRGGVRGFEKLFFAVWLSFHSFFKKEVVEVVVERQYPLIFSRRGINLDFVKPTSLYQPQANNSSFLLRSDSYNRPSSLF